MKSSRTHRIIVAEADMKLAFLSLTLAAALLGSGCAPQLHGANKVGGPESSTWVFINVDNKDLQGVYRCAETGDEGPVCIKAKLKK